MRTRPNSTVAIVGPGRLGQALGKLLLDADVPVRFVVGRQPARARSAARFIGAARAMGLGNHQLAEAGVILMTASDTALSPVARRLAGHRKDWSGRVVLHTCGSLPASILDPFKQRGASTGSFHPYQTIPSASAGVRNLRGCFWAVEGDRRAVAVARKWIKRLGGESFAVSPEAKPLYHLSAFLVCPTVVALLDCSERLLRQAGVPKRVIRPMLGKFVTETVRNFTELGARKSLTGPALRGDWKTLERHIAELHRFAPEVVPAYVELVDLMLQVGEGGSGRTRRPGGGRSAGIRTRAIPHRRPRK